MGCPKKKQACADRTGVWIKGWVRIKGGCQLRGYYGTYVMTATRVCIDMYIPMRVFAITSYSRLIVVGGISDLVTKSNFES